MEITKSPVVRKVNGVKEQPRSNNENPSKQRRRRRGESVEEILRNWKEQNKLNGSNTTLNDSKVQAKGSIKGCMPGKGGPSNSTCTYRGVRQRTWGKWVAEIREPIHGKHLWLGTYDTALEAAHAYDYAARTMFGPNARVNLPDNPFSLESNTVSSENQDSVDQKPSIEHDQVDEGFPDSSCSLKSNTVSSQNQDSVDDQEVCFELDQMISLDDIFDTIDMNSEGHSINGLCQSLASPITEDGDVDTGKNSDYVEQGLVDFDYRALYEDMFNYEAKDNGLPCEDTGLSSENLERKES